MEIIKHTYKLDGDICFKSNMPNEFEIGYSTRILINKPLGSIFQKFLDDQEIYQLNQLKNNQITGLSISFKYKQPSKLFKIFKDLCQYKK